MTDNDAFSLFNAGENSHFTRFQCVKFFRPKIGSCKFFDKQVCVIKDAPRLQIKGCLTITDNLKTQNYVSMNGNYEGCMYSKSWWLRAPRAKWETTLSALWSLSCWIQ